VECGGNLLFGVRSGFKTSTNLVTSDPLPGRFRDLVGATVTDWHALPNGVCWEIESDIPGLNGPIGYWAESLLPVSIQKNISSQEVFCSYKTGPFSSNAALTKNQIGDGHVYYLGWYPTVQQTKALIKYIASLTGIEYLEDLPSGITATKRGPYYLIFNFNDHPLRLSMRGITININARDISIIPSEPTDVKKSRGINSLNA